MKQIIEIIEEVFNDPQLFILTILVLLFLLWGA